ncbi:RTX toxins and related Ca2+-binding proteins [Pelotomaculum thermopropionicum SI]|uniref:RTX toxins and related Ca2+-binding proteins n=1 Tax=Pelotomaculum thermopropionicum (strain DSM 13744 / JCM 10971 / SI) TaxID=370438 RepID=A5D094_PELTS|nr:RTX toxins and related Ca2+-binding proteins [Pelotomaculum thermopropionicum SI]
MGFTFNGIPSDLYLTVNAVRQSILPPVSSKTVAVPKRAGAIDFGVELGVRQIDVTVTIKAGSYEQLRRKARDIADWLYQDDLKPLVFDDEPDKAYYARIAGDTEIEEIVFNGQGVLSFLCPDPLATGRLVSQVIATAKPTPTFARASTAYDDDLDAYATGQPRFQTGQHGQAIKMEEGTTNILTTAAAPATETVTGLAVGGSYTLSQYGPSPATVIDHVKDDDFSTGTLTGVYADVTDLKLALTPGFSDTDTTQADFLAGTLTNVQATAAGEVELTKVPSGTTFTRTETTQADFQAGTLTQVVATAGGDLELATETVNQTNTYTTRDDFEDANHEFSYTHVNGGWVRTTSLPWEGQYSFTNYSGTSEVSFTVTVPPGGYNAYVSFSYQVTQNSFYVYLDGSLNLSASASPGWYIHTINLTAGNSYTITLKGNSNYKAYIDYLVFEYKRDETITRYLTSGNRVNSASLASVVTAESSSVSWEETLPSASTTLRVETSLDGTNYTEVTNGGPVPGITAGMDMSGKTLYWKVTLNTTNQSQTPKLNSLTITVNSLDIYNSSGNIVSPAMALGAFTVLGSTISWTENKPAGTGVTVETSFSADGTTWGAWSAVANGGAIPGLSNGTVLGGSAKVKYRVTLTPTADQKTSPKLLDITVTVDKANSGNRTWPIWTLTGIGTCYSSKISWTATVPAGASLTVETSLDGTNWTAATNGGSVSGLTSGVDLSGKTLYVRQTLHTVTGPNPPVLHSLTVKVAARQTAPAALVKPAASKITLTPANVMKWQLEEKIYRTSFTDGTRQPETLTLDMAGGLESAQGTFDVRAYEDGTVNRYAFLWDSYGTDMGSRFLLEKLTDSTYVLYFNNTMAIKTSSIAAVGWHVYSARWNGSSVWLLIDGVVVGSATLASPVDMSKIEKVYIGSRYSNEKHWNNLIDEVRTSTVARPDADLLAQVQAGTPLPVDASTSCKLEFNNDLEVTNAGGTPALTYNGTARTYPVFTVEFKAPCPYIKVMKGTKQVLVTYNFKQGDVLVIDNDRATIKVNGLRAMRYLDVSSDFFMLDKGLNEFTLEPANKADVTVQFNEKWL